MELNNSFGIADIHTHILPDFDDGAETAEEAIKMLLEEAGQGITNVVLTPHFNLANETVEEFLSRRQKAFINFSNQIKEIGLKTQVNILLGAEVRYYPSLLNTDISGLCIEDTSYMLLELTNSFPLNFEQTINGMLSRGITPILAHLERYDYLCNDKKLLDELKDSGVVFQCNASSLLKPFYQRRVKKLVKKGYVHLLASDTHNLTSRPPTLAQGLKKISKFSDLLISNSRKIIQDELM